MAKDPAFLFYQQDWLLGTMFMAFDEKGMFIDLLGHQADKGPLTAEHMKNICKRQDVPDAIMAKFKKDKDGLYYNKKLSEVMQKRKEYSESRRKNRLSKKDMNNISQTYDPHMENENINEIINTLIRVQYIPDEKYQALPEAFRKDRMWLKYGRNWRYDADLSAAGSEQKLRKRLKQYLIKESNNG